ncbi:MAG: DNA-directed RNA polymerase subunit L [Candidatus Woesearchaeota archaeon]
MKITVLEESKSRLHIEIDGADHTICNALVDQLWSQSAISAAAYSIDHPLIGKPKMIVEVKSGSPKDELKKAIADLVKKNAQFAKTAQKALA